MTSFQRTIATLLLGVYTLTGTSALPALATFLARLDGGHNVSVTHSRSGTHLSLQHQQSDITLTSTEHHTTAGRLVTRFCKNNTSGTHELDSEQLSPNLSMDRDLKKEAEQAPSPSLNHNASLALTIVTLPPMSASPSSCQSLAAAQHVARPSQWPMTATVQLLL
jgi:hypothetical protein